MRKVFAALVLLEVVGCGRPPQSEPQPPVLMSRDDLDSHIGKLVTLQGKVTTTKIPTILGVDVKSAAPDLRGRVAQATGYLQREIVTDDDLAESQQYGPVANRGTGTFYRLKATHSDDNVQVRPVSP